ncbi:MAG: hypothetical protein F4W95_09935 [Chloroflexi bacterium]|nr:hypothetical protein [Chloroflexota bacterium]MYD48790.1 hypothetical protein [Chloroflexota bacterium]
MTSSSRQWEPLLPYPSRESVTELVIAMIERNSGVELPDDWPGNEPIYLGDGEQFPELTNAVNGAIISAEPGGWLMEELKSFERTIAEFTIEDLQSTPEGRATLDAMRATAVERFWTRRQAERTNHDAR